MSQAQKKDIAPARRVTLASVTKTPHKGAPRILVHGQPGVGKTTFAVEAPSPIFICPEDGIPAGAGAVARFPAPNGGWKWQDILDAITALALEAHSYQTLAIDTLDWLEPILWDHLCEREDVDSIDLVGGGYGKGFQAALDGWRLFLSYVERLSTLKSMNVVLLAHSAIRTFKDPMSDGYDRYEMKIHKFPAGLFKEWCDAVLFAQHETAVSKDKRTKRVRGVSTGARIMHTVWDAAYDAKNRYGLPAEMPLSWSELTDGIAAGAPSDTAVTIEEIKRKAGELGGELEKKTIEALGRAGQDPTKLAQLNDWANGKLALSIEQKGTAQS